MATRWIDLRHQSAEGFIDFTGRRFMIDYGSFAVVQIGNRRWNGRSGRARSTLPVEPARQTSALWLMDLLAGISSADRIESEEPSSPTMWRHFVATVNLAEASAASPDGISSPAQDRFENLLELPIEVWSDTTDIRQVRFLSAQQTDIITLSGFGTGIEDLDWTRLPTFGSPKEEQAANKKRQTNTRTDE